MRVGINARTFADPGLRGWNRYTLSLLRALHELDVDLVLLTDQPLARVHLDRMDPTPIVDVAPSMRYARWEQFWLPAACTRHGVDVLHCPHNFGLPWRRPCPTVLTLHDAIDRAFPATHRSAAPWAGRMRTAVHHWVARVRASHIITPSEHAKRDIERHYRIAPQRISAIPEAAAPEFHATIAHDARARIRARYQLPARYVFYVGGFEERKNVHLLIDAVARVSPSDVFLVLAGRNDATGPAGNARTRFLGFVPDDDLPALYAEALVFVYPSRYEGFGLQLCEAMAVGCPVLASRATSLPEVLGDGGETFDPDDADQLAALIARVATDSGYRATLARRAIARSRRFSWARTAVQTLAVYRRVVGRDT